MSVENQSLGINVDNNHANIAGRDIYIQQSLKKTLWDCDDDTLKLERANCKEKRYDLYLKRAVPMAWSACGLILFAYLILTVALPNFLNFQKSDMIILYLSLFVGVIIPCFWLYLLRRADDRMLGYLNERIDLINHILQVRG